MNIETGPVDSYIQMQAIQQIKWTDRGWKIDMTLVAIPPLSTRPGVESEFFLVGLIKTMTGMRSEIAQHKMFKVEPDGFYEDGMLICIDPVVHQLCVEFISRLALDN